MKSIFFPFFLLICAASTSLPAQFGRAPAESGSAFMPVPRELRQYLTRAEKAIEEGRFQAAVDQLGTLLAAPDLGALEGLAQQDFFLSSPGDRETTTSLRSEALRMLATLPLEGRRYYELKFGTDAGALLQTALETGQIDPLREVTRRYLHTRAGYQAAYLLGRFEFDQGRPLAAALRFRQIYDGPARATFEPELSLLLAHAYQQAGQPLRAQQILVALKQGTRAGNLKIRGRDVAFFAAPDQALDWLRQHFGELELANAAVAEQWVMHRGSETRNVAVRGGLPLMHFRWHVPTANDPSDHALLQESLDRLLDGGRPSLPAIQPLAIQDTILMRTPERLVAVDLQTGKRIWDFPWFESPDAQQFSSGRGRSVSPTSSARADELKQRVWDDMPYGQVSSDGVGIYMLFNLDYFQPESRSRIAIIQRGRVMPKSSNENSNELVCLNLPEEGKLRWIVGGEDGQDEPALAGAFFLGAPLPLMDELYVLAEFDGEIRLVVLEAATGKLQWSQQLSHVDGLTIAYDAKRRLAGATPSYSDGILVCPTSSNATVAVDVANRSLLWGYQYATRRPTRSNPFQNRNTRSTTTGQWVDSTATIAGDRVILTPVHSNQLHCLDLASGQACWPPVSRGDGLYVACVHDDHVVVIENSAIRALSVSTGEPTWDAIPLGDARPSGRGLYSDHYYFLPTTDSQLLKIDLNQGSIVQTLKTDSTLGNLVAYHDQLISLSPEKLASYYLSEPLQKVVDQRLAENNRDAWALARKGELLLQAGDRDGAVGFLKRAYQVTPDDETIRVLLVQTFLTALNDHFKAHMAEAATIEGLLDEPEMVAEYLRLMAQGHEAEGNLLQAFDYHLRLGMLEDDVFEQVSARKLMVELEKGYEVRRDRVVQGQLLSLLDRADSATRAQMLKLLQEKSQTLLQSGSPQQIRQFVRYLGSVPAADAVRLKWAEGLLRENQTLAAELELTDLALHAEATIAVAAGSHLVRMYAELGKTEAALATFQWLSQVHAGATLPEGQTWDTLRPASPSAMQRGWASGRILVSTASGAVYASNNDHPIAYSPQRYGFGPHAPSFRYNGQQTVLEVQNRFGEMQAQLHLPEVSSYSNNYPYCYVHSTGHLLVGLIGSQIFTFNLLDADDSEGLLVWHQDLSTRTEIRSRMHVGERVVARSWTHPRFLGKGNANTLNGHVTVLGSQAICYQKEKVIYCVNPLNPNEVYWSRDGFPEGCEIFGDRDTVIVAPMDAQEAMLFRTIDGTSLGTRPIAKLEDRWTTQGTCLLSAERDRTQLTVTLSDLATGEAVWTRSFHPDSKGDLIDDRELALLSPEGPLQILELQSGKVRLTAQLEPDSLLDELYVRRSQNQYLVIASHPMPADTGGMEISNFHETALPMISGNVYALDPDTGVARWSVPAAIHYYGAFVHGPADLPVLVLARQTSTEQTRQSSGRTMRLGVLYVDTRDGRLIHQEDDIQVAPRTVRVDASRDKQAILIRFGKFGHQLQLSEDPQPPAPPVQTPDFQSEDSSTLKSWTEGLRKLFGGAK